MNVYYKTKFGTIIRNNELESAYTITTGKHLWESEKDYMLWLNSIWGKYVVSAHNANELSVEELMKNGQKYLAVHVYADQHNCSLTDAHRAIREMENRKE